MAADTDTQKTVTLTNNSSGDSVTLPVIDGSIGPDVLDVHPARQIASAPGRPHCRGDACPGRRYRGGAADRRPALCQRGHL